MANRVQTPHGHAVPPFAGHSAEHAVTVHMPSWQTALDFIDRKPELMQSFKNMYPRMILHSSIKKLNAIINEKLGSPERTCLLFTSDIAPQECVKYATSSNRGEAMMAAEDITFKVIDVQRRFWAVFFPIPNTPVLMYYWMNAGIGISSRLAEETLQHIDSLREVTTEATSTDAVSSPAYCLLRERIASLMNRAVAHPKQVAASDVYLFSSGMGAIYSLHKYFQLGRDETESTILFGFAFVATAFTLNDFGPSYKFFGSADCDDLEAFAKEEEANGRRIRAVWAELPANPILFAPDLDRLRTLADRYGFLLVVDDTIGSFCNIDVGGPRGGDIIVTSLTKSFNGYSDVMAGSAVLNPCSQRYKELKEMFEVSYRNILFAGDAEMLESNSRDYLSRSTIINNNAQALVDFFAARATDTASSVARVYHPSLNPTRGNYEACMRPATDEYTPGYGGLLSVEFESVDAIQAFYNAVGEGIHIGPHLGAHVTLGFAYVKILYNKDPEEVRKYGLNERQFRLSVGLEPIEELLPVFEAALKEADKYKAQAMRH